MTAPVAAYVNSERSRLIAEFDLLKAAGLDHLYPASVKKPIGKWVNGHVNYVKVPASSRDRDRWVADRRTKGWAVLCGNRQAQVCILDIEELGMARPSILRTLSSLPDQCIRRTPSGGRHAVLVVTDGPPVPTQRLAYTLVDGKRKVLAEVRGVSKDMEKNGSYAVVTGPGRGPLSAKFAPYPMTREAVDELLATVRQADEIGYWHHGSALTSTRQGREPGDTGSGDFWAMSVEEILTHLESVDCERNITLNDAVFILGLRRVLTEDVITRIRVAAVCSGLEPAEIDATIRSAATSALQRWEPLCDALASLHSNLGARQARTYMRTADYLAQASVRANTLEVGMSIRRLSEGAGISAVAACGHLKKLRKYGFLQLVRRAQGGAAAVYRLQVESPIESSLNNSPGEKRQLQSCDALSTAARVSELLAHSAFIRARGSVSLPPMCAHILAALERGPATRSELLLRVRCSRSSISRAIKVLTSAGLATAEGRVVKLVEADTVGAVEEWGNAMDVNWRAAARRLLHESERETYSAWRTSIAAQNSGAEELTTVADVHRSR